MSDLEQFRQQTREMCIGWISRKAKPECIDERKNKIERFI